MEHIRQTIHDLEYKRQIYSDTIARIDETISCLRDLDGPSELVEPAVPEKPDERTQLVQGPARRKYKKRKVSKKKTKSARPKPEHIAGLRGPRKKASQYKGVSRDSPRKDGSRKWRAQYWDGKKQKPVSLGMFETELLAAAAYQDHAGNKAKAAEYRNLDRQQQGKQDNLNTTPDAIRQRRADAAEQAENNPDRTEKVKMVTIWRCSHCKVETKSEPVRCNHCDSASFKTKRVPADSV